MYIKYSVWAFLKAMESNYRERRDNGVLDAKLVEDMKVAYKQSLAARVERLLDFEGEKVDKEIAECRFLSDMLDNGWTVTDMEMLARFYETVDTMNKPNAKEAGNAILDTLKKTKFQDVESKINLLVMMAGFNSSNMDAEGAYQLREAVNTVLTSKIYYCEFPNDEKVEEIYREEGAFDSYKLVAKGKPGKEYQALYQNAMLYAQKSEEEKQAIRDKTDYVIEQKTWRQLDKVEVNEGQEFNHITKSNREAIKEVYGDEVYDEIDEMSRGSDKDRTVYIHHAIGNRQLRKGEEVLELDFAGSGFKEVRREYHGQHGKAFGDEYKTRSSEESIESEFGKLVMKNKTETFKYLRSKTSKVDVDGKTMYKTRYTIAGPSPENGGLWNYGEYSIQNTREYGKKFATKFLSDIFKRWDEGEVPTDVHINLTGHSRGAVAACECVRLVNDWLKKYKKENPDKAHYIDRVKFDLLLRDPVPGLGTSLFFGTADLRKIPNLNTTVFCSMAQEHYDMVFPLQCVKGAKRVIIGTTGHNMDLANYDKSQINQKDDRRAHKEGFYDAETGEVFRGSGMSEMPEGVYIADDKYNLVRITSFSQVGKLINSVYDGKHQQRTRVKNIHRMVRSWFVENDLQMGFADEEEYEKAAEKFKETKEQILSNKVKRVAPVKKALQNLEKARERGLPAEEIVKYEAALITAGKEYMKKTRLPATGDSEYRMNMVSDLVTFAMREKNYIVRSNNLDKGRDPGRELDEKIRKHKERLENKPGYIERKLDKENKRLQNDQFVKSIIVITVEWCDAAAEAFKSSEAGAMNPVVYHNLREIVNLGKKLTDDLSVNEFKQYLNELKKVADAYQDYNLHSMGDPTTKVGKIRTKFAVGFSDYAENALKNLDDRTRFYADKNKPISEIIRDREASIAELEKKLPQRNREIQENKAKPEKENKAQPKKQNPVM